MPSLFAARVTRRGTSHAPRRAVTRRDLSITQRPQSLATTAQFAELEVPKFTSHSPRPAAAPSDSPQLPRPEVTRRGPSPSTSHSPRLDVTRRGPSPSHWSWQSPRPAVTRHGRRGGPSHSLQPESESAAAARVTGTSPLAVNQARRGPSHSPRPPSLAAAARRVSEVRKLLAASKSGPGLSSRGILAPADSRRLYSLIRLLGPARAAGRSQASLIDTDVTESGCCLDLCTLQS